METHFVRVLGTRWLTHNVIEITTEKPHGYHFEPGQATDISIDRPGYRDEIRPFTFTSLPHWAELQFTIKVYPDHHGLTEALGTIRQGERLILHEVFGAIGWKGYGLFIAGGAGVTPFIAILRKLRHSGRLNGCKLIFANRSVADIIHREELAETLGANLINVVDQSDDPSVPEGHIGIDLLRQHLSPELPYCYVCGPDSFTNQIVELIVGLGRDRSSIIIEQ